MRVKLGCVKLSGCDFALRQMRSLRQLVVHSALQKHGSGQIRSLELQLSLSGRADWLTDGLLRHHVEIDIAPLSDSRCRNSRCQFCVRDAR
jgi:hypothetical protein